MVEAGWGVGAGHRPVAEDGAKHSGEWRSGRATGGGGRGGVRGEARGGEGREGGGRGGGREMERKVFRRDGGGGRGLTVGAPGGGGG